MQSARIWRLPVAGFGLLSTLAALAIQLKADPNIPIVNFGFVQGILVERTPSEFAVESLEHRTFRFSFDRRTWIERERARIPGSRLQVGEHVEVVSDRQRVDEVAVYARLVTVVNPASAQAKRTRPVSNGSYALPRTEAKLNGLGPDLTLSGRVVSVSPEEFLLQTKWDGVKAISLRPDTVFLMNGDQVDLTDLAVNRRLFVRARRNPAGGITAYEMICGAILHPASDH